LVVCVCGCECRSGSGCGCMRLCVGVGVGVRVGVGVCGWLCGWVHARKCAHMSQLFLPVLLRQGDTPLSGV